MKSKFVLSSLIFFAFYSCQPDAPKESVIEENSEEIVIEDTVTTRNIINDSNAKPNMESDSKRNNVVSKSIASKIPAAVENGNKPLSQQTPEKALSSADDIDGELNNEVNRKMNPDNYNGVKELNDESKIVLVPISTNDDKKKYYVQFIEKPIKISKVDLNKISPNFDKIYVINHLGLYKYAVGQFNTEVEALAYKNEAAKKYGLKKTEVVTYSDAW